MQIRCTYSFVNSLQSDTGLCDHAPIHILELRFEFKTRYIVESIRGTFRVFLTVHVALTLNAVYKVSRSRGRNLQA